MSKVSYYSRTRHLATTLVNSAVIIQKCLFYAFLVEVHNFISCKSDFPNCQVIKVHHWLRAPVPSSPNSNCIAAGGCEGNRNRRCLTLFFHSIYVCTGYFGIVDGERKLVPFGLVDCGTKIQYIPLFRSSYCAMEIVSIGKGEELATCLTSRIFCEDICSFANLRFAEFQPNAVRYS